MQLFYAPGFSPDHAVLPEEEARHALKALRLGKGDRLHVTDGQGQLFEAQLLTDDPKKCHLSIVKTEPGADQRGYSIHIAVSPTKNADRTEWLVEKCVEIGVDQITFVAGGRSERKFFKTDRVEKIAVAAMKQSLKTRLPRLNDLTPLNDFLKLPVPGEKFIAHLEAGERRLLQQVATKGGAYCVLIGPEGDFTPAEIIHAMAAGFAPVSLGDSRLRTETAGVVACHTLHVINA